jgi:putative peptide zinc metalloprotease protein
MVSLADSLRSSSARSLPVRKRPDLQSRRHHYLGKSYWIVKDPVGLNYFRFQEEEYFILQMLDGQTSLDEIKETFESEFPPQKITLEELQNFLGMLHRSGMVISAVPDQGRELLRRFGERRRQEWLAAFVNILCLRFKGVDPEWLLNWLLPRFGWLFTRLAGVLFGVLVLSAAGLVLVQFDVFRAKLPAFHQFFNLHNAMYMACTLAVTKVLHELGHGLSCRKFGGECHEIGVMLLVLTPCLYCNVSDSWMLPNKWHRAMIGAAGMYIELILASICTFIWWFTEPGVVNLLCLNVIFICSVSTVMFNGNPLLRYDGYYILADLMEMPNLRQKATQILSRKAGEWFLGMEQPEDPFLPQRNQMFFVAYSVAAAIYRWFITLSILVFLYKFWEPYRLEIIGGILGLMSLYGIFVYPLYKVGKFFYVPGRREKVKKPRMYASMTGVVLIVLAIAFVPLPHSVMCTLEIQARDAIPVYAEVPGILEKVLVRAGDPVRPGQVLAQLTDIDTALKIDELSGSVRSYSVRLTNLRQQRYRDPKAGDEIPAVAEALQSVQDQLKNRQRDLERMTLKAPDNAGGVVLPPPPVPRREDPEGNLPMWAGTPLELESKGAHLQPGTLFCQIGDPTKMEAILVIPQADIDFVAVDQKVDIKLDELPHDTLRSQIAEIAQMDLRIASQRMSNRTGGPLATKTDTKTGIERPLEASFQARVPIDDQEQLLRVGLRGQAKVHAKWMALGPRLWLWVTHTFNFRM